MQQPTARHRQRELSEEERLARLRLIRSDTIGGVTFWGLINRFGSALEAISAVKPKTFIPLDEAQRELDALREAGGRLIACGEPDYPRALAAVDVPPPLLSVRGSLEVLAREMIAIVGARNASALGARFAREMAVELGSAGFAVASGLARGIDTAAHKGSLPTGTCAVMAGGIDVVYPPENKTLYDEIVERGVVVSELPFSFKPVAQHFPRRNRIISGLARGVVVVEAAMNSGSLITARIAGEQGRDVFAVPGSPLDPRARGTNGLLRQGAILTESAEDVLTALQSTLEPHAEPPRAVLWQPNADEISGLRREILNRLGPSPVEIDELVRQIGSLPAAVAAALLDLEFEGKISRHAGQKVALSGS
ncbi:MAG: DNA-protecting protein DprA [Alphaproteobacteria bacterium]|nr:DNA-protecting protein DprA [Alphaproteobacteria bacterium]